MTNAQRRGRSGWGMLVALALPAVILEFLLFVGALFFQSRSCSDLASRIVTAAALAIVPVGYLFLDRFHIVRTIVMTLICLIPVAIAGPGLEGAPEATKQKETRERIKQIAQDVERYAVDHNRYPAARNAADLRRGLGKDIPERDAWCRPIQIQSDAKNYAIVSYGKDGVAGGNDDLVYRNGTFE